MNPATTRIKGIPLELGGTTYIVPPLSLGAIQNLQGGLASFNGDPKSPEQITLIISTAHAALKRNYPDITVEQVGELVGLENMMEVMEAIMDISGLKRKAIEAGEAPPAK